MIRGNDIECYTYIRGNITRLNDVFIYKVTFEAFVRSSKADDSEYVGKLFKNFRLL